MFTRKTLVAGLVLVAAMASVLAAGAAHAAVIGTEDFGYPDGSIAGQTGGAGWDVQFTDEGVVNSPSNWSNVFGSPSVSSGALVTNNSGARREYSGPSEGATYPSAEREGALRGTSVVYYRVQYTQTADQPWSGMSSYDFGTERIFFGQPSQTTATKYFGIPGTLSNVPVVVGQTYDLVAEVNFTGDQIGLWVNPVSNPTPVATQNYTATNWSTSVRLASGGQTTWDNLIVATKWADLGLAPRAGLLSYEPLAGYASGDLAGQAYRGSGYKPNGTWTGSNATVMYAGSLTYGPLRTAGGMVTTNNGGGGVQGNLDSNVFDQAGLRGSDGYIGGSDIEGTLYYSFLGQRTAGGNAGASFAGVELYQGGNEVLGVGNNWDAWAYSTFGSGIGNHDLNSADPEPGVSYEHVDNNVHLFVVRIDYHAGANDDVTIWLDPAVGLGEADQSSDLITKFAGVGNLAFDSVHFRSGNAGNTWNWDELRFGTTFASVLTVPEPSTFLLAALGLLSLGLYGWRQKRKCA